MTAYNVGQQMELGQDLLYAEGGRYSTETSQLQANRRGAPEVGSTLLPGRRCPGRNGRPTGPSPAAHASVAHSPCLTDSDVSTTNSELTTSLSLNLKAGEEYICIFSASRQ